MKPFTHLHVHSHYSLLTALPRIKELVKAAKADGMTALGLTDNGNLYGAIEFFQACKGAEIKPILGIDTYLAPRTRHDKEPRIDSRRSRIIFIAKNYSGYQNLIKMVSDSYLEGFYYKPRVDKELIEKYHENLICISPFFNSEISNALRMEDYDKAKNFISYYKNIYGEDFYLEVVHHPEIESSDTLKKEIVKIARETNTKIVAAHDVYYMTKEDRKARDTLVSVQSSFGSKDTSSDSDDEDFSFINQETANKYFADLPDALDNIQEIVDKCDLDIPLGKWKFPNFIIESGLTPDQELRRLAEEGIKYRGFEDTPEFRKRFDYELEVIATKGYSRYFLTVSDMLKYAKSQGILTNTRGSAAGSLISYLIQITTVDPIELNLPFERFLNPERPSAPDIDMDFADNRRDDMIVYVRNKYGKDHVAQIGTFGTMLARGSVRDVARAMGFEYAKGDLIAKLIPMGSQGFPMTIDRAIKETAELEELYKTDADTKTIIDMAKKIEGCARHIGVHAAGVVISPDPLTEDVPIQFDPKGEGKLITQYDMHAVGEDGVGLLKFDFLGLKNLTIMGLTIKLAKVIYDIDIDIDRIPLDDKKTYEMLARGETAATFQLNGAGMTRFLKELKPTNINDINAMVALYRPGPMDFIPDFIERKHNPAKASYIDERFKKILEPTFGILIYQDDIMMIAVEIAGYTWGAADKFRKAMGKKIPEVMREQKEKFEKGCVQVGGLTKEQTHALWESIETFAAYGFNKAHAASYGRVAYLTSYLKANFPVLYMAAVLTSDQGEVEKVAEMIAECKRMGINVLPPDINESFEDFTVIKNPETGAEEIRFGLTTIKNFGEGIAHEIIEERKLAGPFNSIEDFVGRIHSRSFNKKSLEALIKTGALDRFGDRGCMLAALESLLAYNKEIQKGSKDQSSLFGEMTVSDLPKIRFDENAKANEDEKLMWEKELLGLFISGHPLDKFKEKFENPKNQIETIKKNFVPPKPPAEGEKFDWKKKKEQKGDKIVAGMIETIRVIKTKKNDDMAFVKIADFSGSIEVVFFPEKYTMFKNILLDSACIAVQGTLSDRNGEISMLAEKAKKL